MTPRTLALIGPMGAGKTSIGRKAARRLGVPFADTDARIVAAHGPISDIFRDHGEPTFRTWERQAVEEALAAGGVVSLGGGAVLDRQTQERLRRVPVLLLTVDAAVVARRLAGSNRPLLAGEDAVTAWRRVAAERDPLYRELADEVVDTSRRHMGEIAQRVADWTRARWDAFEHEGETE